MSQTNINSIIIGTLVDKLNSMYKEKQIGKTIIQKMMFILSRKKVIDVDFSLHHYGPYSPSISDEIDNSKFRELIRIEWRDEQGYFITSTEKAKKSSSKLSNEQLMEIEKTVKQYGQFKAGHISLIATALFIQDNFNVPLASIPKVVHDLKPNYSISDIKDTLKKGGVL